MARKVSGGLVGEPSIGAINVAPTAVVTAATNQNITLSPTGTGSVVFTNNAILNAQNDLRFGDADSSNWVAFQAPATIASNVTWTLPDADGTNATVLTTNGSGTLTWQSPTISITNNTIDSSTHFVTLTTATTDTNITGLRRSSTGMTFQPSTGTLTVTNLVESSSIALKENIAPIENALDSILKLSGVTYNRKDTKDPEAGLIAEWVDEVLPELVTKDTLGNTQGVKYTKLTAYLIEAIRTLKKEIDEIKQVS
jgi:hypothetical protein